MSLLRQTILSCLLLHFLQNLHSKPHYISHAKQTIVFSVELDSSTIIIPQSLLRRSQHSLKPKSSESLIFSYWQVRHTIADNCLLLLFSFHLTQEYKNTTHILMWKVRFYFTLFMHWIWWILCKPRKNVSQRKMYPTEKCIVFLRVWTHQSLCIFKNIL